MLLHNSVLKYVYFVVAIEYINITHLYSYNVTIMSSELVYTLEDLKARGVKGIGLWASDGIEHGRIVLHMLYSMLDVLSYGG